MSLAIKNTLIASSQIALLCFASFSTQADNGYIEAPDKSYSLDERLDDYFSAWSEIDPAKRLELLEASVSEDIVYRDPQTASTGTNIDSIDKLSGWIGAYLKDMEMYGLTPTSGGLSTNIDHRAKANNDGELIYFGWKITAFNGNYLIADGVDFAETNAEGEISSVTGFFGKLTPLCQELNWENKTYVGGDLVTHNKSTWKAKWWTQDEPGLAQGSTATWVNLGPCATR